MKEQIIQAYGSNQTNPYLRKMAPNQGRLIFNPQERKAVSQIRGSTNTQGGFVYSGGTMGLDREIIRRGAAVITQRRNEHHSNAQKLKQTKQEFILPSIQGMNVNSNRLHQSQNQASTEKPTQKLDQSYESTYKRTLRKETLTKIQGKFITSRQQAKLVSPIRSFNHPQDANSQPKIQSHNNQVTIDNQAWLTSITFGGYDHNEDIDTTMQKAISNINLKLNNLQSRLQNFKVHENQMIEEIENETSQRGTTHRSGTFPQHKKHNAVDLQSSLNFDQLSCVSSELQL